MCSPRRRGAGVPSWTGPIAPQRSSARADRTRRVSANGRVVIVGGGFAGLAAAARLAGAPVEVQVVDQHNFHTFQPLLYQVATAGLDAGDVAYPIRTIVRGFANTRFVHGRVSNIDLVDRTVGLEDGTLLPYEYLIVASGATAAFFGVPGADGARSPSTPWTTARWVRNKVLAALEHVDSHSSKFGSGGALVVVVGGGPTGVETAGALSELLDITIRHDRLHLDPDRSRVVLLDRVRAAAPELLAEGEHLRRGRTALTRRRSPARRAGRFGLADRGEPRRR